MKTTLVTPQFEEVEAMQEIEVISTNGYDNIATSCRLSSTPIISSAVTFPPRTDSTERVEMNKQEAYDAMQALLAMVEKEQTIPPIDYDTDQSSSSINAVTNVDRQKMCEWYYEMADFLKIDRSTASRAMMLLDRFMATSTHAHVAVEARQNRDKYQLFALTSLFISVKLFERLNIQAEHVSYLSRGRYGAQEIIKIEIVMLTALQWKVSEASKVDYVDVIMKYIVPCMENVNHLISSGELLEKIKELAMLQIQLSDFEVTFASRRQSIVAFAAVCNAFETKKAGMSHSSKDAFYECIKALIRTMSLSDRNVRDELGSTIQELRLTVDPQASANDATMDSIYGGHDTPSFATKDVEDYASSPAACAENFGITSLLCCGSSTPLTKPPQELNIVRNDSNDVCKNEDDNSCNAFDNCTLKKFYSYEKSDSFDSVDLSMSSREQDNFKSTSGKKARASNSSRSPTSIAKMLCGL